MALVFDATYNNADVMRKVRETQKAFAELGNTAEIQGRRIDAAFEKISLKSLERMIEIMKNFPKEIQGLSSFQKQIDGLEKHIERVNQRIASVGGGKLGSTFSDASSNINIGDVLKEQVYVGSQAVNDLTEKIISQRKSVRELTQDIDTLNEAYKKAGKDTDEGKGLFADLTNAKTTLKNERNALFDLQTQQAQARLSVRKLRDEQSLYQKEAQDVASANEKMSLSFQKTLAAIGGTAMIQKLASDVVRVRGEFQQLEIAFGTMLKSKDKASALMSQLTETAAKTPFDLQSVAQGAKQLLAYGTASEEVNDTLIRLGNIASGLSIPLGDLVYLYGTTQTQGRLFTQDVRQFMGRGIPLVKELAAELGKTEQQINEMVTAGQIGFSQVEKVIRNMTSENGQFYNLMEKQSQSLTGQISNLGDAWDGMLNKIGTQTQGIASAGISAVTSLIENYEEVGVVLASLVASYGTYKAAIIVVNTLEKANIMIMRQAILEKNLAAAANITLSNSMAIAAARGKMFALVQRNIISSLKGIGSTLANPYVLLGAAVGAATYGLYKFYTRETEVEQMQRQYNDTKEAAVRRENEHKAKVDELINSLEDETTAQMDRVGAIEALKLLYPGIIEKYIDEEGHLRNLIALNKELAEFNATKKVEQNKTELQSYDERIKNQEEYIDRMRTNDQSAFDDEVAKLNELKQQRELSRTNVASDYINKAINEAKSMSDTDITNAINTYQKALAENKNGEWFDTDKEFKVDEVNRYISALKNLQTARATAVHDKEYWEKLKKETQSQLDALSDVEASGKKGLALKQKITGYENKINKAFSTNTTKQESAADTLRKEQEKYNLLLDKQKREAARMETDSQHEIEQIEINGLVEGSEKVLRQRALNHDKEIETIKREAEDKKSKAIEEARSAHESNPDKKKGTFDADKFVKSEPAQKQFAIFDKTAEEKTKTENTKYNRGDDFKGLLDEYQDFADQRLAIEKKYNEDIKVLDDQRKTALKNGDMEQVAKIDRTKVQAEKNKKEDLSGVSLEEFKADIDWATLFGNLDVLSPESLNKLRDKLKAFIETAADKLKPEDLKVLSEAMTNVDLTIADKTPYEALKVGLSGYKVATSDAATAQEKLNKLQKDGKDGTQEYKDATKELTDAQRRRAESLKTVTQAANNIGSKGVEVVNAGNEIVGMLENFGVAVPEAVGETLDGIGQVMSGLESIDITKPFSAVTGAITVLTGVGNTIAGLLGFGSYDYSHYNEMKEQYESISSIWDELISKKTEYLEVSTTEERKRAEQEILDLISKQEQTARNLGLERLNSGASLFSNSIGVRIREGMSDEGWSQWDKFANSIGMLPDDIGGRLEELFSLSSEQLDKLRGNAPDFWAKLDGDVKTYLEDIIKCGEKTEETTKKTEELWAGISFDSMVDQFRDALSDMDSSTEDFADDFQQYMINAMIDSFINGEIFQKKLKDWHKRLAEYSESDKKITKEEKESLKDDWNSMVQEGLDYRNNLFESMGFSNSKSTSQSSTSGGFETMSQDTGSELNGRFTALQISNEEIKNSMLSMLAGVNLISTTTVSNGITLTEIRNVAISSNSYLEDIAGFQKRIITNLDTKLANIERSTKIMAGS